MTRSRRVGLTLTRGMVVLCLGLGIGVLLAPTSRSQEKAGLPADLHLVPRDAAGFVSVRVADLWGQGYLKSALDEMIKTDPQLSVLQGNGLVGVEMSAIERLTVIMPKFPQPNEQAPTLAIAVRTRTPVDGAKVQAALLPMGQARVYKGKTIHSAGGGSLCLLDPQTFVMGPTPALEGLLDASQKPGDGPMTQALAHATKTNAITASLNPAPVRQLMAMVPDPQIEPFKPLFEAKSSLATFDVAPSVRLRASMTYGSPAEAMEGARQAKALVTLFTTFALPMVKKELGQVQGNIENFKKVFADLEMSLREPPVTVAENTVTAEVSLKSEPKLVVQSLLELIRTARVPAAAVASQNNLKQIALAMHSYHDTHGRFPAMGAFRDKQGKALLSWRVALLPYLDQDALYKEFKLDEPWDSAHNKKLLAKMPAIFKLPGMEIGPKTHYRGFVGGGAFFDLDKGTNIASITDGTSNTLMVVEATEAVEWTKPDDLTYDPKKDVPKLGVLEPGKFQAAFGDGSVRRIKLTIAPETLRALITRAGGEAIGNLD